MSSALIVREIEGGGRGRRPAFLPADLRPDPHGGLYQGLYKRLRGFILDGVWPAGTRLPSSRALAADLNVSRNTAILAVEQLIADGWAESRSRSGVYVSSGALAAPGLPNRPHRSEPAELPVFALQRPATDLFPAQIWKQLQARAWAEIEPQRLLSADPAGDPALRDAIARLVCAPRGLRCHADQILVLPSATLAFDLIAATLARPGEQAVVEDPSRPVVRQLLRARGVRVCPVPVDGGGLDFGAMLMDAPGARLACISPSVQFPTAATLSPPRRARLLDWARGTGAWIVEDDRDSEAWFVDAAPPLPLAADDGDRVIFVGSFNRLLFPGLCVAFMVAPPSMADRLRAAHASIGGRASLASQLALSAFIAEGHFSRHLRRRRAAYAERRRALGEALGQAGANAAGLHFVLPVKAGAASALAAQLAAERLGGLDLDQLSECRRTGAHLLFGLGATPEQIRSAVPRLQAVLATQSRGEC